MNRAFLFHLPRITAKWPQAVIVGKKITKEQAKDILVKTDLFFTSSTCCGNDYKYDLRLRSLLHMPPICTYNQQEPQNLYEQNENWQKAHGCLELNYFNNNWITSCYVGGPYGWCHIDGTIYSAKNIGKWPDWEEIYDDLSELGHAFPFLDLCIYIINCEFCCGWDDDKNERICLGGLHLCNGNIEIVDPIDPFSDICKWEEQFIGISRNNAIPSRLINEVSSVVTPVEVSSFKTACPNEHIFKIEEALEYFGTI